MTTAEYIELREISGSLLKNIFKEWTSLRSHIERVGKKLGVYVDGMLVLDSEEEFAAVHEYLLFEPAGIKAIRGFIHQLPDSAIFEREVLDSMLNSYLSIFEIVDTNPHAHICDLSDLLHPGKECIHIMDIGLSKTGVPGLILCSRLFPFRGIWYSSGLNYAFHPDVKSKLLSDLRRLRFKRRSKWCPNDLIAFGFKKHSQYGIPVIGNEELWNQIQ